MSDTPATLPANFFESKTAQASPPKTLPANFDFKKGAAPPPLTSPEKAATQATGLRPGTTDEWIQSLMGPKAPSGFMMHGDKAAGVAAEAEGSKAIMGLIGRALKPTVKTVQVASKMLDPYGKPMISEVEEIGESAAKKGLGMTKDAIKNVLKWANANPVPSYVIYKTLEELGVAPHKAMKILHAASE